MGARVTGDERRAGRGAEYAVDPGEIDVPGIPHDNHWYPNQAQARGAALRAAHQMGRNYRVAHDPRPGRGQPHYHVEDARGNRISGHFFYGASPPRRVLRRRPWREAEAEAELEFLLDRLDRAAAAREPADASGEAMLGWLKPRRPKPRATPVPTAPAARPAPTTRSTGSPYRTPPPPPNIAHARARLAAARSEQATAHRQAVIAEQALQDAVTAAIQSGDIRDVDRSLIADRDAARHRLEHADQDVEHAISELQRASR